MFKKVISTIIAFSSASAIASNSIVIDNIKKKSQIEPKCETCLGGKLVTTTTFYVSYQSCAEFRDEDFVVNLDEDNVEVSLKPDLMDCQGPSAARDYRVKTKELSSAKNYRVKNLINW